MSITLARPRGAPLRSTRTSPFRVALIGPGSVAGLRIVRALEKEVDVEVVAVVADDVGPWAELPIFRRVRTFDRFGELVDSGIPIDLVLIAASREPLAEVVAAALAQSWHVLSDPLFAEEETTAVELVSRAFERCRRLLLLSARRFMAAPALRLVQVGAFGADLHLVATWWRAAGPGTDLRWLVEDDAVLTHLACPLLDLTLPFFGGAHPRSFSVTVPPHDRDGMAMIRVELVGGGRLDLTVGADRSRGGPEECTLALWGGQGSALVAARVPTGADNPQSAQATPPRMCVAGGSRWEPIGRFLTVDECYREALRAALRAIDGPGAAAPDALPAIRLGEHVRRAMRSL